MSKILVNLLRAKSNLYGRTQELVHHDNHIDMAFPHKGGIFYVNSNNGGTRFEDNTFIESVRNRALLFSGKISHETVTQTDTNFRFNININYNSEGA